MAARAWATLESLFLSQRELCLFLPQPWSFRTPPWFVCLDNQSLGSPVAVAEAGYLPGVLSAQGWPGAWPLPQAQPVQYRRGQPGVWVWPVTQAALAHPGRGQPGQVLWLL